MYVEEQSKVVAVTYEDKDIQLLETEVGAKKAILFKAMTPTVQLGDHILVNLTATHLKLGTGGWDFVKAVSSETSLVKKEAAGHIMKLRYTPIQHSVLAIEAQESPFHSLFKQSFSLNKQPVLLGELHSMIPVAFFVAKVIKPTIKICVIIDDQAALPLLISEQIRVLKKEPNFTTITVGQAFGGTYEAVSIQSALQFAKVELNADLIMISVGPGVVGTGTTYGFTGITLANWANIVGALDGIAVWIPRLSFAEKRERHVGISHHTLTPLFQFTYAKSLLPFPFLQQSERNYIDHQIKKAKVSAKVEHEICWAETDLISVIIEQALQQSPLSIRTMGRGYTDDPAFFLAIGEAVRICLR